ncbi:MAG: hypothetical protein J5606_08520 [Bacteroidales bacterium]|nr:hypothetical protein [Bacteroidales bacterium]
MKHHYILITAITILITIACLILPMNLSPIWSGKIPMHTNQYEKMAESLIEGHLYLNDKVDSSLLNLSNPYDPQLRTSKHVKFNWDHAFYKGHYYMYFGITPVIFTFLPYRLITGHNLPTLQATQTFTIIFIIGIFLLFLTLARLFFKTIPFPMYLCLSVCFSIISVWYISAAPILYCTAISAGLAFGIWSIYFFIKSAYNSGNEKNELINLAIGSLLGALTFGCRPPIALFNIVLIPILIILLQKREINHKRILKIGVSLLPYVIVGILLMVYNYLRFDNPFEFGQSYQLTNTDQHNYGAWGQQNSLIGILEGLNYMNFKFTTSKLLQNGIFMTFPILFLGIVGLFHKKVIKTLKEHKLLLFITFLFISNILISIIDCQYSPFLIPRYRTDILWLTAIATYIIIGHLQQNIKNKQIFNIVVYLLAIFCITMSILLFLEPHDNNFTYYYELNSLYQVYRFILCAL